MKFQQTCYVIDRVYLSVYVQNKVEKLWADLVEMLTVAQGTDD